MEKLTDWSFSNPIPVPELIRPTWMFLSDPFLYLMIIDKKKQLIDMRISNYFKIWIRNRYQYKPYFVQLYQPMLFVDCSRLLIEFILSYLGKGSRDRLHSKL